MAKEMQALDANLQAGATDLGMALSDVMRTQLLDYLALMAKWNQTYNLTAIREPETMLTHHLLDSLAIVPYVTETPLLDVGAGAGLPGLPLAMVRPDLKITLVEANGKKCAFMAHCKLVLKLANVEVLQARVETLQGRQFGQIVSRAFSSLADFLSLTGPLLAASGRWLAMKGQWPEDELRSLGPAFADRHAVERIPLQVPGLGAERNLIVLQRREAA